MFGATQGTPTVRQLLCRPGVTTMAVHEVVVSSTSRRFAQSISAGAHTFSADEPAADGGDDTGPNPYDLLLASLGACTSMTLLMYARRKSWPLEQAIVRLTHERVHAHDSDQPNDSDRRLERIHRTITLVGPALTDEQRSRLKEIAERCPVHKTLTGKLEIRTEIS
jgi:putative redox protein